VQWEGTISPVHLVFPQAENFTNTKKYARNLAVKLSLGSPWRYLGKWRHWLEASGQPHAPVASPSGISHGTQYREICVCPRTCLDVCRIGKSLAYIRSQSTILRMSHPFLDTTPTALYRHHQEANCICWILHIWFPQVSYTQLRSISLNLVDYARFLLV
jgi:hypothetical protein